VTMAQALKMRINRPTRILLQAVNKRR